MNLARRKRSQLQPGLTDNPFNQYTSLQDEINYAFDNFFNSKSGLEAKDLAQAFVPTLDIVENEKSYTIKVELPGLKKDDIDLQIDNGQLVLKGERKKQHEEKLENMLVSESSYGTFYRSFPLPDNVDAKKNYSADLKNGILSIFLPKKSNTKSTVKSIPIKTK